MDSAESEGEDASHKAAKTNDVVDFRLILQDLQLQQERSLESIRLMVRALDASQVLAPESIKVSRCFQVHSGSNPCDGEKLGHADKQGDELVPLEVSGAQPLSQDGAEVAEAVPVDKEVPSSGGIGGQNRDCKAHSKMQQAGSFYMSSLDDKAQGTDHGRPRSLSSVCRALISSPQFEWFIGCVIFADSVCAGIGIEFSLAGDTSWPGEVLDVAFVIIYALEVVAHLAGRGWVCLRSNWFVFDLVLVLFGMTTNVFLPVLYSLWGGTAPSALKKLLVIRSLRLLRLVRAVRSLPAFRTLWTLVYGLLTSGNAMASTLLLLVLTLYIFACIGIEFITKDSHLASHEDTAWIVSYHFGSLPRTLASLMAFVCADSVAAIYFPLMLHRPALTIYFVLLLLTVSVALMNLVTAVLVEGALRNAANDKELLRHDLKTRVKKTVPKLMKLFAAYDTDGSGELTREEIARMPMDVLPKEIFDGHIQSMVDVFDMLDVSHDGCLSAVEFVDGIMDLYLNEVPIQTLQIMRLVQLSANRVQGISEKLAGLEGRMACAGPGSGSSKERH